MRLIDVDTLEFREFIGSNIPPYIILSHTWNDEELTYQDMLRHDRDVRAKEGYTKLIGFLSKVRAYRFKYAWIDTCCINKESSAELSEAINSMYMWYKNSAICIAYLSDYIDSGQGSESLSIRSLERSRWFRRGWTLQELVAPRNVHFYGSEWKFLDVLPGHLASITRIPEQVIRFGITDDVSVAQKMCWASTRETTRTEDVAYCLLGLFDVHMPLLYGEGEKAFQRLQEEIIRTSNDQTIFLWRDRTASDRAYRGLLARHPVEFSECDEVVQDHERSIEATPYNLTNMGIQLFVPLLRFTTAFKENNFDEWEDVSRLYVPLLRCREGDETWKFESIVLRLLVKDGQRFVRVFPRNLFSVKKSSRLIEFMKSTRKQRSESKLFAARDVYVPQHVLKGDLSRAQILPAAFLIDVELGLEVSPSLWSRENGIQGMHSSGLMTTFGPVIALESTVINPGSVCVAMCAVRYKSAHEQDKGWFLVVGFTAIAGITGRSMPWYGLFADTVNAEYFASHGGPKDTGDFHTFESASEFMEQDRLMTRATFTKDMLQDHQNNYLRIHEDSLCA